MWYYDCMKNETLLSEILTDIAEDVWDAKEDIEQGSPVVFQPTSKKFLKHKKEFASALQIHLSGLAGENLDALFSTQDDAYNYVLSVYDLVDLDTRLCANGD